MDIYVGFIEVGGFEALQEKYFTAIPRIRANNTTCGLPDKDAFHLFRDPLHADHPWPGLFLQASIGCLWYWCADQVRNTNNARSAKKYTD